MSELKSCPFCGGETECYTVQTIQLETGFVVKCKNLDCVMCSGGTLRQTPEEAINAWNTRKPVERILERLKEEMNDCKDSSDINEDFYVGMWQGFRYAFEIIEEEVN